MLQTLVDMLTVAENLAPVIGVTITIMVGAALYYYGSD
jgi:hypothetical protein